MVGYQLNANGSYFNDCTAYFAQMPSDDGFGGQEFLHIKAISTKAINVDTWNGSSFQATTSISEIPAGTIFT
ncbi:hypothetical protein IKS57_04040 [bacterium]|nr:hypothetical protein [bacterium]